MLPLILVEVEGQQELLEIDENKERRKLDGMKRSKKSEETLTSCVDEMRQTRGQLEPRDVVGNK